MTVFVWPAPLIHADTHLQQLQSFDWGKCFRDICSCKPIDSVEWFTQRNSFHEVRKDVWVFPSHFNTSSGIFNCVFRACNFLERIKKHWWLILHLGACSNFASNKHFLHFYDPAMYKKKDTAVIWVKLDHIFRKKVFSAVHQLFFLNSEQLALLHVLLK